MKEIIEEFAKDMIKEKKHDDKVKLVEKLLNLYDKTHNRNMWNENDTFDVLCWFAGDLIVRIAEADIIPEDELKERIKAKFNEHVDDVFAQIAEMLIDEENPKK